MVQNGDYNISAVYCKGGGEERNGPRKTAATLGVRTTATLFCGESDEPVRGRAQRAVIRNSDL